MGQLAGFWDKLLADPQYETNGVKASLGLIDTRYLVAGSLMLSLRIRVPAARRCGARR